MEQKANAATAFPNFQRPFFKIPVIERKIRSTEWAKNGATLHFSEYLKKLPKIIIRFLHTSRSVCTKYVYNVRVCSCYYIKWRHLVNLIPLDNAVLKLKHNGLLTLILTCAAANDLNLMNYDVWRALQEMLYHCRSFNSLQELKNATVTAWQQLCVTSVF